MALRSKLPGRPRALGPVLPLEDRVVPAAAFVLADDALLLLDTANPAAAGPAVPVTGLGTDTLVGIDFRPANGTLYGLGVDATAGTATLYAISTRTGAATPVGAVGAIALADPAGTPTPLPDPATAGYGVDFNPSADRLRVVTTTGVNFRVDPNTGAAVDTDPLAPGAQPDVALSGAATGASGAGYTNNTLFATTTTLYVLDDASDSLLIQGAAAPGPNGGVLSSALPVTLGGAPLDFTAVNGFDVPAGVDVATPGDPANGAALAALTVGGVTNLYSIELSTGEATLVGPVGGGTGPARGLALQGAPAGLPAVALSGDGTQLVEFATADPATATTAIPVVGVDLGEVLVGIDYRPATGQLYALGVNATADTATLYLLDPDTGEATPVGAVGTVALTDAAGTTPVDLPDPSAGYGFDFNPVNGLIRVVTGTGLNFRVDPATGAAVDADAATTGDQPDAAITSDPVGTTGATGAAYTNGFGGAAATTLYVLDSATDSLFIQGAAAPGPNGGVLTGGVPVTLGGAPLDFDAVNGFDIPAGVTTDASGSPAAGTGYALLTVGGATSLYSIDLATGAATDLGQPAGLTGGAGLALGAAPAGVVQFAVTAATVAEGAGSVDVTLTRTDGGVGAVTVTLTVGGTATPGDDFTAPPTTVTFADGETTRTVTIPILDDTIDEVDETIILTLSDPTGGGLLGANTQTTLTITDDDTAGSVQFDPAAVTVAEDGGSVTLTLTRTGGTAGPVTVDVTVAGGTATAGADFTDPGVTTVTFAAGETTQTITIPILDDNADEPDETIILSIGNPTGGATVGGDGTATVTITDNDVAGTIDVSVAPATVAEGVGTVTVTLTRTGGSDGEVSVTLAPTGTAAPGADFTLADTTVTFADGETTKTVTLTVVDDAEDEPDETVVLTATDPTGGAAVGTAATLTITDNDGPDTVGFSVAAVTVGEADGTLTLTVTRTGGTAGQATLALDVTGGSATDGTDFGPVPATVTFAPGETTQTVVIPIADDAVFEGDETFVVTLSDPTGASIPGQTAVTVTITDDDTAPAAGAITFEVAAVTVAESGGTVDVVVNRIGGSTGEVTVTVVVTGTATPPDDFGTVEATVTFADGETTKTITIPIVSDTLDETDETIILTLTAPTGGAVLGERPTTTVTITDNPAPGTIQFSAPTFTAAEGGGAVNLTLTRTDGSDGPVAVALAVTGGTATAGADFTAPAVTVTFAAGQTTATVAVAVADDALVEGDETVVFTLSDPTGGATLGAQTTATVTITDNDAAAGTIAFGAATFTVSESGGSIVIPLTRTGGTTGEATVTVGVSGTATGGTDFTAPPTTVTFAAGSNTATLTIPITNDTADEPDETVVLTLSAPTGGAVLGTPSTATLTITDDDPTTPAGPAGANLVAVSGQPNGTTQVYQVGATGALTAVGTALTPFAGFNGVVRSTTGDVNGDGIADTIAVTGPGTAIRMTVISGAAGNPVLVPPTAPFAGSEGFTGGGFVAAADLDGDGRAEWVVTPDQGGGPRVTIFSLPTTGTTATVRANFLGITGDPNFRGGARPALGDVNNDGTPDLAVAAGFLGGPRVALFNGRTVLQAPAAGQEAPPKLVGDFFAFPGEDATRLRNGAFVAIGDADGDGFGDLVFGGGPGGSPRVFVLDGELIQAGNVTGAYAAPIANFFVANNSTDRGGVRVATADADGDGRAEVLAASGAGSAARVRTYLDSSFPATGEPAGSVDLTPFGGVALTDGVFVG
ncbi:MAG: DUF4394 domain-containing protein [Gemmataceae bacterium]|nr:DUF4394 domain-containing protein [Gemmataceae bacterium]